MLKLNANNSLPLLNRSITDIHQLFKSGKLNPIDLFEACRQRAQETRILNAFITLTDDLGLKQATDSSLRYEQGKSLGLLDGLPLSFKDNFSTKNVRTTCASKMLENYHPPFNATVVEKLFKSGGAIIGKTNMDEFAMGSACSESYFGPTYHPWNSSLNFRFQCNNYQTDLKISSEPSTDQNHWFIAGGSSGGSAVSVATGASFAALSSDTGGSTRNPASRLGIVGFKPSYGVISRYGLIPLTHSLDVPGIMARNVEDVLIVFSHLHGFDEHDSTTVWMELKDEQKEFDLTHLKIGIPNEYYCQGLNGNIADAWEEAKVMLADSGARIVPISLPHTKYSLSCYTILNCSEVASNFACYDGIEYGHGHKSIDKSVTFEDYYSSTREEALKDIVKSRIMAGNYFLLTENYRNYFEKALRIRRLISNDFDQAFQDVDFILTPVCITSTMNFDTWNKMDRTEEAIREDYCTQPANMAGLPAITVPFKLDKQNHNLPIGLQILARKFDDFNLLRFAMQFQSLVDFPHMVLVE